MKPGVAKRVSQFKSTGSSYFDEGYKAGWEAAKKYYTRENEMPVPQGDITTTDIMNNLVPEQEAKTDDKSLPSDGQGESGVQDNTDG